MTKFVVNTKAEREEFAVVNPSDDSDGASHGSQEHDDVRHDDADDVINDDDDDVNGDAGDVIADINDADVDVLMTTMAPKMDQVMTLTTMSTTVTSAAMLMTSLLLMTQLMTQTMTPMTTDRAWEFGDAVWPTRLSVIVLHTANLITHHW